ncbi:MarR family winged helix-turn-helix transcriptional regulator [Streptomyces mirabilis]|uniref:MarR family winged helix-turn-helix transcriptional regulator n=1 Tax=Streptomyces TaxID=1883 RepID=UPI0029B6CB7A|nr:MarR family winged helix-turn-helix transcriptional regulator [Streptomyces sp. AK02-04a]MDX3760862.1 MarR family winged helix-turn-helix transcriptional regulator [Streptomyces sp. AK02-04a]
MRGRKVTPVEVGLRYLSLGYDLRRVVDDSMTTGGLSLARTKVLQVLDRRGTVRQSVLAQELGQAPRSVTQSVEALEREGLVERTADPHDGRSKLVRLTPEGTKALIAGTAAGEQVLREVFGAMGPDQLGNLDQLLDALRAALSGAA